jgi:hypothetical protein
VKKDGRRGTIVGFETCQIFPRQGAVAFEWHLPEIKSAERDSFWCDAQHGEMGYHRTAAFFLAVHFGLASEFRWIREPIFGLREMLVQHCTLVRECP